MPIDVGSGERRQRRKLDAVFAYFLGAVIVAATSWPLFQPVTDDSYPISHFPMFAIGRLTPELSLAHVRSIRADGSRKPLSPRLVGNGTVMQAAASVAQAISSGSAQSFCNGLANRVRTQEPDVRELEIVTGEFHVIDYFRREPKPLAEQVHARCSVEIKERAGL